jgi:hypothetical protein
MIPDYFLGIDHSVLLYSRLASWSMAILAWTSLVLGETLGHLAFWRAITALVRAYALAPSWKHAASASSSSAAARARVRTALPTYGCEREARIATPVTPEGYFRHLAEGTFEPVHAKVVELVNDGVRLEPERVLTASTVVWAVGFPAPSFPYFREPFRSLIEPRLESSGLVRCPPLFRHCLQPLIPCCGFVDYNHNFLHIPGAVLSTLWLVAAWRGEILLPSAEDMVASAARAQARKDTHRAEVHSPHTVGPRFHQSYDVLCSKLGICPWRKLPNLAGEVLAPYGCADYATVVDEYLRNRLSRGKRRRVDPRVGGHLEAAGGNRRG